MKTIMETLYYNTQTPLTVHVHKEPDRKICPICNERTTLLPYVVKRYTKEKCLHVKFCTRCDKKYINFDIFQKYSFAFDPENKAEIDAIIKERLQQEEELKRVQQRKKDMELARKQAIIDSFEACITSDSKKNIWKNHLKNQPDKVLSTIFVYALIQEYGKEPKYYFITTNGRKREDVQKIIIAGKDSVIGRSCLECLQTGSSYFSLMGTRYNILTIAVLNKQLYQENVKPVTTPYTDVITPIQQKVYVYFRLSNSCVKNDHPIESVNAETHNVRDGNMIKVNVFYCRKCRKYFINHEVLLKYASLNIYPAFNYELVDSPTGQLKETSELMMYGYNVRAGGLSEKERHSILGWVIDTGLISKQKIIKDLQFKVSYNGKKTGNEEAKKKWMADIDFVSRYTKGNTRFINADFKIR